MSIAVEGYEQKAPLRSMNDVIDWCYQIELANLSVLLTDLVKCKQLKESDPETFINITSRYTELQNALIYSYKSKV